MRFHTTYFLLSIMLFITEVLIALYAHDGFVRPYLGDVLVVILLYCMVRTVLKTPVFTTAFSVLLFAYFIELMQYFQIVKVLGLQGSKLANVVIGNYFTWNDILSYTAGFVLILIAEKRWIKEAQSSL